MKRLASILSLALLASPLVRGEDKPGHSGHWEGTVDVPGKPLAVAVDLSRRRSGAWRGNLSLPAQDLEDFPLRNVTVDGLALAFELPGLPGDPVFQGKLSDDGATISGELKQGGAAFPFKLQRKGDAAAPSDDTASIDPKIDGEWKGEIYTGSGSLRLTLKVTRSPEGIVGATIDSPDQGRIGLPINTLTLKEGNVRFELRYIKAYYEGVLNKEGSEITGTWNQEGRSTPLALKRVPRP